MAQGALAVFGLTDMQERFVKRLARTGDIAASALAAGYARGEMGWHSLKSPGVMAALDAEIRRILQAEAAPIAIGALIKLVQNSNNERIVHDAAKSLASIAGYGGKDRFGPETNVDKPLVELTTEELRALVDKESERVARIEQELIGRAKVVGNAPSDAPNSPVLSEKARSFLD